MIVVVEITAIRREPAEAPNALCKMAEPIYAANQEAHLATAVSEILSAGAACAYASDVEPFITLWRVAAEETNFTARPHLHNLKAQMLCAPVVGVSLGMFYFVNLCREKLTEILAATERTLRQNHAGDLSAALDAAVAWAGDRKQRGSIFEGPPEMEAAIESAVISCGLRHLYIDRDTLQKRLQHFSILRSQNQSPPPVEFFARALIKGQFLDALANQISLSAYFQASRGQMLLQQIQNLIDESLRKEQPGFFEALSDDAITACFNVLRTAFLHNDSVQQLRSDIGTDFHIFEPPLMHADARPRFALSPLFSEEAIWAGETAVDLAAADGVAPQLLLAVHSSIIRQAAKWVGTASRGQGSLTTDFIRRIFGSFNKWFGFHSRGGTLTPEFQARALEFLSRIGHILCESEIWLRDDHSQIFYWTEGIAEWTKDPKAADAIAASIERDRARWDLYSTAESLQTDLEEKGLLKPAAAILEPRLWTSPAENPRGTSMTIILPLEPQKEAKLIALAQEKGISADDLVREAIDKILAEVPETGLRKEPSRSLRGLFAKYGPVPSAEEIDENRARTQHFCHFRIKKKSRIESSSGTEFR